MLVSIYGFADYTINHNPDPSQPTPDYSVLAEQVTTGEPFDPPNVNFQDPRLLFFLNTNKSGKLAETLMHSKDVDLFRRYSPINNVGSDYPPIYLAHGASDAVVPSQHSVLFAEVLKGKGIPYEIIVVPDAVHGFDIEPMPNAGDEIWGKYISPSFDFVQKYL